MELPLERFALISDIHSNIEALRAVLNDIRKRGIETIVCLGDVVGYGPDPKKCIDLVSKACVLTLMGNHDEAVFYEPMFFNPVALRALHWTRDTLMTNVDKKNQKRIGWLAGLPQQYEQDGVLFVHASPRDPLNEYVTEMDIQIGDTEKFQQIFSAFGRMCFIGHTHVPAIITESLDYIEPGDCEGVYAYQGEKLIINVGSVGQPRDGNSRACYVEVAGNEIRYHRVRYRCATTMLKIKKTGELHEALGARLLSGV